MLDLDLEQEIARSRATIDYLEELMSTIRRCDWCKNEITVHNFSIVRFGVEQNGKIIDEAPLDCCVPCEKKIRPKAKIGRPRGKRSAAPVEQTTVSA